MCDVGVKKGGVGRYYDKHVLMVMKVSSLLQTIHKCYPHMSIPPPPPPPPPPPAPFPFPQYPALTC